MSGGDRMRGVIAEVSGESQPGPKPPPKERLATRGAELERALGRAEINYLIKRASGSTPLDQALQHASKSAFGAAKAAFTEADVESAVQAYLHPLEAANIIDDAATAHAIEESHKRITQDPQKDTWPAGKTFGQKYFDPAAVE